MNWSEFDLHELTQVPAPPDDRERETAQGVFRLLMAKGEAGGRRAWMEEKGHLIEADI